MFQTNARLKMTEGLESGQQQHESARWRLHSTKHNRYAPPLLAIVTCDKHIYSYRGRRLEQTPYNLP
jgi:hypothetical protein